MNDSYWLQNYNSYKEILHIFLGLWVLLLNPCHWPPWRWKKGWHCPHYELGSNAMIIMNKEDNQTRHPTQPTCDIFFDEYVWDFEQELAVKDVCLPSAPLHLYSDVFHDSIIFVQSFPNSFLDVSTFDHSQKKWNASFWFECREVKYVFLNPPNLSYYLYENIEGEISRFS